MKRYAFLLLFVAFGLCACKPKPESKPTTTQPEIFINAPALRMGVSRESCTSMEVQMGTQVTWMNDDTVTLSILLEKVDENGNSTEISQSEISPGNSFSTQLNDAGAYRFHCSDEVYGTITVK